MKQHLQKKNYMQICIVVADIEKAAEKWAELLGIEKPEVLPKRLEGGEHYTYHGQAVSCDLKVCNIEMDGWMLELHQPCGGPSSFQDYLDKHGNGVHHIGFRVGDERDAMVEELKAEGIDAERTVGINPGRTWTIVDLEDILGVNINLKKIDD